MERAPRKMVSLAFEGRYRQGVLQSLVETRRGRPAYYVRVILSRVEVSAKRPYRRS